MDGTSWFQTTLLLHNLKKNWSQLW